MKTALREAWQVIHPSSSDPDGGLPPLLAALTVVTGLVDAFSYLELGRVFVANMTGNVIFLAFAIGGASGFIWWASLLGIAAFLCGSFLGGRFTARFGGHRGAHLSVAAAFETGFAAIALIVAVAFAEPYQAGAMAVLIIVLGCAMGLQNATARSLGVADLTTTVLTLTITGIASDSGPAGGSGSRFGRRMISILLMFSGGVIGAALVTLTQPWTVLAVATIVLVAVAVAARRLRAATGKWASPR